MNFDFAIEDVTRLLKLHDGATKRRRGRPAREIEVFKRAGIILGVTAWESFIEDTIRTQAERKIKAATSPSDVQTLFNSVAYAWLFETKPKPPDLAEWVGAGWKELLICKLKSDVKSLNTPDSKNIKRLSKLYLDADITASWHWARISSATAASRLDRVIRLRGELAHRGPELFKGASVRRREVADAAVLLSPKRLHFGHRCHLNTMDNAGYLCRVKR